jgi:hypothetical protein
LDAAISNVRANHSEPQGIGASRLQRRAWRTIHRDNRPELVRYQEAGDFNQQQRF